MPLECDVYMFYTSGLSCFFSSLGKIERLDDAGVIRIPFFIWDKP